MNDYWKTNQNYVRVLIQLFAVGILTIHADAGPTLTDLWNESAVWVKDSENIGRDFGFYFISILHDGHDLQAYYIHNYRAENSKLKSTVGRARSLDGVTWTNDGMVLDVSHPTDEGATNALSWDNRLASFPGIWKDGGTWYLVYEGAAENIGFSPGDIGLAISTDGTNFVKYFMNPILRHSTDGWERVNIGTPSLYKENGLWYLFYHGFDGNVCQIGVASGVSLTNLAKSPANPIVPVASRPNAWDFGTIGRRSGIVKEGRFYYFAFEGSTAQPYDSAKWSSGFARSTNLLSGWTKFSRNPVIPQTSGGFGNDGPELLQLGKTWYLYARSPHGNASERFRLISSDGKRNP
ncbi:MAG: hypothetical protein JWO95_1715 [Verrucomicrobiales bacterium]|nr:hypothetical protein [Verrucomicrobiales bacterium]